MIFTTDSSLVKLWSSFVLNPNSPYELEDVPKLFNLKEMVTIVVNSMVQ